MIRKSGDKQRVNVGITGSELGSSPNLDAHARGCSSDRNSTGNSLFDDPVFLLPRPTRNPEGKVAFSAATFRGQLREWLRVCDIRDELGREVHVTPHQWRHTFGTRLINNEVPQETVRRLLDHDTHAMTSHYARLSDKTIREQWERARKVNIAGEQLAADTGPLADAAWMKNNLARAKMALPNGYCALPLQQKCEFANLFDLPGLRHDV